MPRTYKRRPARLSGKLATLLRRERELCDLSMRELAEKLGTQQTTVCALERGDSWTLGNLESVSTWLRRDPWDVLKAADEGRIVSVLLQQEPLFRES